ncbi:MAG: DUF1501 domain-containing protein [Planctomycetota bacterium]|nr:DUF1501 domain-containing protein [Planctomycetota bacterium]
MLTLLDPRSSGDFCDGLSRRSFLKIGGLSLGGLSLSQVLEAESRSGIRRSHKAVIMVYLPGGPTQLDLVDLKPDAPLEIRGPFRPIATRVPGLQISELLPRTAAIMDRLVVIRSLVGSPNDHASFHCLSGRPRSGQPRGGWPTLGSVVSRIQGATHPSVPPYVDANPRMGYGLYRNAYPSFLGVGHSPFSPRGEARDDMVLEGVSLERLADRKGLLSSFDRFRHEVDSSGMMEGLDAFTKQAFGILTSGKLAEALDLRREDARVLERYGDGGPTTASFGGAPRNGHNLLLARRLVEAGARCVTVSFGAWDWHGNRGGTLEKLAREDLPAFDQSFSALVEDLCQRGLDRDVSVVVWGEFGRTPRINKKGGRDHWPQVACAILAGGGVRTGQVLGKTDRHGAYAVERPVHLQEVFATLYHNLGIDVNTATVEDLSGRPRFLVDANRQPIRELL